MRRTPPHVLGHYVEAAREIEEERFRLQVIATLAGTHTTQALLDEILGSAPSVSPKPTVHPATTEQQWRELARTLNRGRC